MDNELSKEHKKKNKYQKIFNDLKFKLIPRKVHKIELNDNRFNTLFSNKDFVSVSKTDKYGKLKHDKKEKNQMDEYYIKNDNQQTIKKSKIEQKIRK